MPFPAGVLTRVVELPTILDSGGSPTTGVMTVSSSLPLKWGSPGQLVMSDPVPVNIVAGTATIELPILQSGFVLSSGVRVDVWTYRLSFSLPPGVEDIPDITFVLPAGVGNYLVDFVTPPVAPESIVTEYVNVPGDQGPVGDQGPQGEPGTPGAPGPPGTLEVFEHGSNAAAIRPVTAVPVIWVGTVQPDNWIDGDQWINATPL